MKFLRILLPFTLPATLLLFGCTTVPETLVGEYGTDTPAGIDPQAKGTPVRWGGVIVDAMPDQQKTCFAGNEPARGLVTAFRAHVFIEIL